MTGTVVLGVLLVYVALFGSFSALVYWDGKRVGMDGPEKWTGFVFFTGGTGFFLYLSERDTTVHEFDEADPFSLPGSTRRDHQSQSSSRNSDDLE